MSEKKELEDLRAENERLWKKLCQYRGSLERIGRLMDEPEPSIFDVRRAVRLSLSEFRRSGDR